jgi:hypothetical protein
MITTFALATALLVAEAAPAAAPAPAPVPAPAAPAAAGKLAPDVSKQMMESIVAVNKALGLESWPMHGAQPCVDRGGQGITAKDVTPAETRKCAATAISNGFPNLGKSYVLAIPMTEIGPVTVIALGIGDSAGWGAYSCDPERKCTPVKVGAASKWGKRMAERQAKACGEATTLWFPENGRTCAGAPAATAAK